MRVFQWRKLLQASTLPAAVLLAGCALAYIQSATPYIPEFDGYYHIKMAQILREKGFLAEFPWLPLTTFSDRYADMHLLFHYILVPFTLLGMTDGAKLYAVLTGAMVFLVFSLILKKEKAPWAGFWVLVLFTSTGFLYRFSLPRVGQLSVLILLVGLVLIWSGRGGWLFFLSWVYAESYVAFPILLLFALLHMASQRLLGERGTPKPLLYIVAGMTAGLILNPYFPNNVWYYYTQAFQISTMQRIPMGGEWQPWDTWSFLRGNAVVLACFFLAVLCALLRGLKGDARSLTLFLISTFLLLLTFMARRFIEYLVPFAVLFSAVSLSGTVRVALNAEGRRGRYYFLFALLCVLVGISAWRSVKQTAWDLDWYALGSMSPMYEDCARWLRENTPEGSLVFHADWDDFPALFFFNTHNHYIVGLDPNFLYLHDPRRWSVYAEVTAGRVQNPAAVIRDVFGARYVFTDRLHERFLRNLRQEDRSILRYDDGACAVYELPE